MTRWMLRLAAVFIALAAASSRAADGEEEVEAGTIGTGIMGVITGVGSIHVTGHRILLPDGMVATSSLGVRPVDTLKVGETVIVEAERVGETLRATRIRNYYPLVAPVDLVGSGRLTVLGLDLDISELAPVDIIAGDWVALSGLWRGDTVIVSDLRKVAPRDAVVVNGSFSETDTGAQYVGPFAVAQQYIDHAEIGDQIRVTGTWSATETAIVPMEIEIGLFSTQLTNLLIEGYMSQPDPVGRYTIYGSGIVAYTDDIDMRLPAERSVFCVDLTGPASITQGLELDLSRAERDLFLEEMTLTTSAVSSIARLCGKDK